MPFADVKNDFVFRRIFATHPEILRGLLNDLLERTGDETIVSIEYLPREQRIAVEGAKLSILDVRCKDRTGTTFVFKMQLIHHPGFLNRVIYSACSSYVAQLQKRDKFTKLKDVVVFSICDFDLWPDAKQTKLNLPLVPMLSRWNMTERHSKNPGLLQVQYAFLELPKVPTKRPETSGVDLWAWLFVHAPELREIPADLAPGPQRDALELANQAKFTQSEMNAYEKVRDEIRQVHEIAEARWAEGKAEGKAEAKAEAKAEGNAEGLVEGAQKAKRDTLFRLLTRAALHLDEEQRARIAACESIEILDLWIDKVFGAKSAAEVFD